MDKLLQPESGLIIWTIVTFLSLVAILRVFAWKPILEALNNREGKIKSDLERAEKSQKEAEALRLKFESQLAEAQKSIQEMMAKAHADGERSRAQLVAAAREESEKILEKGRKDLSAEADRLKDELRKEVAEISLAMVEKILPRSVDQKVQEQVLRESLKSLSEVSK